MAEPRAALTWVSSQGFGCYHLRMLRRAILLFVCLMAAPWAHADDYYYTGSSTFLDLGRYHTPFRYADGDHQADVGRFGVAFSEQWDDDYDLDLHGGYLTVDVDGEPRPVAQTSSGRYLGLKASYAGTEGNYLNFDAELSYTWMDVNSTGFQGAHFTPPSELTWYETWVAAGPELHYAVWRLSLGAYWQGLDGTETDSAPYRLVDFRAGKSTGAYLGLSLYIEPTYSITLRATSGARRGVQLVFRRDF